MFSSATAIRASCPLFLPATREFLPQTTFPREHAVEEVAVCKLVAVDAGSEDSGFKTATAIVASKLISKTAISHAGHARRLQSPLTWKATLNLKRFLVVETMLAVSKGTLLLLWLDRTRRAGWINTITTVFFSIHLPVTLGGHGFFYLWVLLLCLLLACHGAGATEYKSAPPTITLFYPNKQMCEYIKQ